jgi:hypothetical protein
MSKASKSTVNLDTAARLDIICRKGDTFTLALDFGQEISASSNWHMEVRETDTSAGTIIADTGFSYTVSTGTATNSKLTIQASSSVMALVNAGLYVYDLQDGSEASSETVKTYLYGTFKVNEDVTVV